MTFLVFLMMMIVVNLSGHCNAQWYCTFAPCKRQERTDDSASFANDGLNLKDFGRNNNRMKLANYLRANKKKNFQDLMDED
ncbi:hypothetical protein ACROYT_G023834 [Oculina patagonica]